MTGAAWLSSARVVRCWVKSRNERNPYLQLPSIRLGTLEIPPRSTGRKVGMTSSPHGLYVQGYTRATMGCTKGSEPVRVGQSQKAVRSSDRSPTRLREVGIASNRGSACRGEYVPGPCTHRPSHHESWLYQKSLGKPFGGAGA